MKETILLFLFPLLAYGADPAIYLRVGQRYPIEGIAPQEATISPESIASAHRTPEGVLLVGHRAGTATLSVSSGTKKMQVKVVVSDDGYAGSTGPDQQAQARMELRDLPGLHLSTIGDKTVVQGEILGRSTYQRVLLHLKHFPATFIVLATAGSGVKASLIEQANSSLRTQGLEGAKITNAGNRFFLEGNVSTPEQVEQALEIAQSVLPNVENHVPIPIRIDPTISIRIYLLELSRQAHQALGLSWPSSVNQAMVLSPKLSIFNPSWSVNIEHLSANGQARVLAEPVLSVKSGSNAELWAGGEIPIRITGRFENKVVWKNYGLRIKLQIGGIAGRYIRTKIDTESSQLDEATAVDGVPGIRTNNMSTEIDAFEGQPILLTGLFQSSSSKDVEKIPILGSIPLLGELFKSRRFREHESELLVALLPSFGAMPTSLPLTSRHGLEFDARWRPLD